MNKLINCLIVASLLLICACKQVDLIEPKPSERDLLISEAKDHFESLRKRGISGAKKLSSSSSKSSKQDSTDDGNNAIWDLAQEKFLTNGGNSVLVPMDLGPVYQQVSKGRGMLATDLNYYYLYKDSVGNIQTEWVALYPDSSWAGGDRSNFKGRLHVQDLDGNIKRAFSFRDDGKIVELNLVDRSNNVAVQKDNKNVASISR